MSGGPLDRRWLQIEDLPPPLGIEPAADLEIEYPHQGLTSNVALLVRPGRSFAVKRCCDPTYLDWLRREHQVLCSLRDSGLPVPEPLGFAEREGVAGTEVWLAMTVLPGEPIWQLLLDAEPENRSMLMAELGAGLRVLHHTPIPAAFADQAPWIGRKLKQAADNLSWCDGSPELLDRLVRSTPPAVGELLIHGDLALDNVLMDRDGTLGFLDWSAGDSGDPRFDLAVALDTSPKLELTDDDVHAFYTAYGSPPLEARTRRWFQDLTEFF